MLLCNENKIEDKRVYQKIWFNLHMPDGAIHYKLYLLKLTMAVDNVLFRIIKGAF